MASVDRRAKGTLHQALEELLRRAARPEELVDPARVEMADAPGPYLVPDCENCPQKCCAFKSPDFYVMLGLRDIASLVDGGLGDLIVGRFVLAPTPGLPGSWQIEDMPRLAKKRGSCVFYDPVTGLCGEHEVRPNLCRRYPYELDFREGRWERPFTRMIPGAPCPERRDLPDGEALALQLAADALVDENMAREDLFLLPDHLDELRAIGFARFLPEPQPSRGRARGSRRKTA